MLDCSLLSVSFLLLLTEKRRVTFESKWAVTKMFSWAHLHACCVHMLILYHTAVLLSTCQADYKIAKHLRLRSQVWFKLLIAYGCTRYFFLRNILMHSMSHWLAQSTYDWLYQYTWTNLPKSVILKIFFKNYSNWLMLLENTYGPLADLSSILISVVFVFPIPACFLSFLNCRVWSSCERENAPQHPSSLHCGPQHEGCQVCRLPGHCAFWTTGCHLSRFLLLSWIWKYFRETHLFASLCKDIMNSICCL